MTHEETKLVEDNVSLARYVARTWVEKTGMETDDAVSAAMYGLVKAATTFKLDKGYKFSTYAVKVMQNEMLMEMRKYKARQNDVHLDDVIAEKDGKVMTIGDTVADKRDLFGVCEAEGIFREWYKKLTNREREVVAVMLANPESTQKEVGEVVGVSQTMVSRYLKSAKRKWKRVSGEGK